LAKIYKIPFSLITKTRYCLPITGLISEYRETPFTLQDGLSEWRGNGCMYIAEYKNELAGIMRLDERRTCWGLSSFIVNPALRGSGIGEQMLQSVNILDKPVYLKVKQDNPAIHLYLRQNFEVLETKDGRHTMKKWIYKSLQ